MSDPRGYDRVFETKDSGERQQFDTGMVRDVQTDKPRYDLLDMPMLKRWAELMARGAKKYGENNWKKAATQEELERFKASAMRHLFQWFENDVSEDHAAAVMFNIAGAEMVKEKLKRLSKQYIVPKDCDSCAAGIQGLMNGMFDFYECYKHGQIHEIK